MQQSSHAQGSDGWHEDRRGMLTASRFGDVMAGKQTKRYQGYMREIVLELSGAPVFKDDAEWFEHGLEHEAEGIGAYAFHKGVLVKESGFVQSPALSFVGCSPDGLVEDGGLELKCRSSLKAHHKTVKAGIDSNYKHQVQGCMWICGAEWWDFVSYYVPDSENNDAPITDLHIHRVYPDVSYINKLEVRLQEFWDEVQQQLEERKNA